MQGHKKKINALCRRPKTAINLAIYNFNKLLRTLHFKEKAFGNSF